MDSTSSVNASAQKPRILFVYWDERGKYLADALQRNYYHVDVLRLKIDSKELFFWTNLLMCTLEIVNAMTRKGKFSLIGKKTLINNSTKRPQFTRRMSSKVERHVNSMPVKPDLIMQWSGLFAPYVDDPKNPFAVIIDNYSDPPNSLTNKNRIRGWNTIYDKSRFKFEEELFSKATYIFPFSKWAKNGLSNEYMLEADKIHSIGWGPCKRIKVEEIPLKEGKSILAIGTDYVAKGIDILIKCADYLKDFSITIVGKDNSFDKIIMPSNVKISGFMPDEKLVSLYKRSELFFIFSEFEPAGHVLWEAQACGCVIIGYDAYGISEAIINGETGLLLKTRNPKIVAENIRLLYQDASVLKRMQKAAIDNYMKYGTWDKVCEKIIALVVRGL
jgi:glycosyltransferase involved in cell wall biosynthesis